jgi:hypothetical protein
MNSQSLLVTRDPASRKTEIPIEFSCLDYLQTSNLHLAHKLLCSRPVDTEAETQRRASEPGEPREKTGIRVVEPLGFEGRVARAIRHHHEHWNGDGDVAHDSGSREASGLRLAHYSVYPRAGRNHGTRAGYTRNGPSRGRSVLVTTTPEAVGELLRIRIHGLGALDALDALARVASCQRVRQSRFELHLVALVAHAPRSVRSRGAS